MAKLEELDQAGFQTAFSNTPDKFEATAQAYTQHSQEQVTVINAIVQDVKKMSWQEVVECGAEIGTRSLLDLLTGRALGLAARVGPTKAKQLMAKIKKLETAVNSGGETSPVKKVFETVATEGKRTVGGAPKPSAPHTTTSTKPTATKPQITNPRKPPSSGCKRPLDTACEKADSLVPATAQKAPQPPAPAPKKQKISTQPETRAPPSGRGCQPEVPKRVTRSAARAAKEQIEIFEKNKHHIFRNVPGHFTTDTLENRKLLLDTAKDPRNFLGPDKFGNQWYAKMFKDKQIWARVRNGKITDGGINIKPRLFNSQTGLCRP